MKHKLTLALAMAVALTMAVYGQGNKAETLLGTGLHQEEVELNCIEAIKTYQKIIQDKNAPKHIAGRAQLHIGACYEKLGKREARVAYEMILARFADDADLKAEARTRLTLLGGQGTDAGPDGAVMNAVDNFATITPNGQWLSMADWSIGELIVRNMVTGETQRLLQKTVSSPGYVYRTMVSPDGQRVAYLWYIRGGYELRVMPNRPGADSQTLLRVSPPEFIDIAGWSGDMKSLLVEVTKPDRSRALAWMSIADAKPRVIKEFGWRRPPFSRPNLSHDGRYIAYAALKTDPGAPADVRAAYGSWEQAERHIYVISASDGTGESEVVQGNSINDAPLWSPDGSHILFVSNRSLSFGVWAVGIRDGKATGNPALLVKDTGKIEPIALTQEGRFYYRRGDSGPNSVDVFTAGVRSNGMIDGPAVRLSNYDVDSNQGPAWSPDGKKIAFIRGPGPDTSPLTAQGPYQFVLFSLDSGEETVHPLPEQTGTPIWFSDSESLFLRRGNDFHAYDVISGQSRPLDVLPHLLRDLPPTVANSSLALAAAGISGGTLSPDDRTVYLFRRQELIAFDLTTDRYQSIWTAPAVSAINTQLAVSPDGKALTVLTVPGFAGKLVRVATDGSGVKELHPAALNGPVMWSKDSRYIYFFADYMERTQLMRVPANGDAAAEPAGTIRTGAGHPMSLSPDGSRVVFSASTRDAGLWVLDNLTSLLRNPR